MGKQMQFLHNGVPVPDTQKIHNYLNIEFLYKWKRQIGPPRWPLRYFDITKTGYFLGMYVNEKVYKNPSTTKNNVKTGYGKFVRALTIKFY